MNEGSRESGACVLDECGSISGCLASLRNGVEDAEARLYLRYWDALAAHCRQWAQGKIRRVMDEEDIAQETLSACLNSIRRDRSNWVRTRMDFWSFLVASARNRAFDLRKKLGRKKRGGDTIRGESAFIGLDSSDCAAGIENAPDQCFPPDRAYMAAESFRVLLASLRPEVRQVALLKEQGYSNREIACRLGVALVTVNRRLKLIRNKWKEIED